MSETHLHERQFAPLVEFGLGVPGAQSQHEGVHRVGEGHANLVYLLLAVLHWEEEVSSYSTRS